MMRAAKCLYFTMLFVGLTVGTIFGFWNTEDELRLNDEGIRMTAPAMLDNFSFAQYKYADTEHATVALHTVVGFLEEMEHLHPGKEQEVRLTMAYTRLALLADRTGGLEQSHGYMTKAKLWNAASGGQDYSESEMKARLNILDSLRPIFP
jgi:hypothetical protein